MDWADSEDASGAKSPAPAKSARSSRGNSAMRKPRGEGLDAMAASRAGAAKTEDSTPDKKAAKTEDTSDAIGNGDGPLPEKTEIVGRDGVKVITEWFMNDEGKRVKRVIKTKMMKKEIRVPKAVIARRTWVKFGVCTGQKDGAEDGITRMEGLSTITMTKKTKKEQKESVMQQALNAKLTAISSKTKYKAKGSSKGLDGGATGDDFWDAARKKYYGEDGVPDEGGDSGGLKMTHTREGGGYVAPARRAGAGTKMTEGSRFGSRDDSSTVRITNLSDEAVENDLQELCRPFGPIQRVYLARDKQTSMSRGFAFVNYHRREDAIKAIEKLNGYGYDNLILRVEWAKPSGDGPGDKKDAPAGGRSYSDRPPR